MCNNCGAFLKWLLWNLQLKADKIIANAKEEAVKLKAYAAEECEKGIADSHTQAERVSATIFKNLLLLSRLSKLQHVI